MCVCIVPAACMAHVRIIMVNVYVLCVFSVFCLYVCVCVCICMMFAYCMCIHVYMSVPQFLFCLRCYYVC